MRAWTDRIRFGVIDDARHRHGRERRRLLAGLLVIAIAVAIAVALFRGSGPTSVSYAADRFSVGGMPVDITLAVAPVPGGATASFGFDGSYVTQNNVHARGARVLTRWDSNPPNPSTPGRIMFAIVGPGVAAVRAGHIGTFEAKHVSGLPPRYKAVVFYYPNFPALDSGHARTQQAEQQALLRHVRQLERLQRLVPLVPLNAAGSPIASTTGHS